MRLFGEYLLKGFDYKNRNIRIKFMGDRTVLDEKLQQLMNKLEADSSVKTGMTLNIAINYGGARRSCGRRSNWRQRRRQGR